MYKDEDFSIEEIIVKNSAAIFRYCLTRLNNNHHDAEEVTSNVMFTLFLKWDKLKKDNITAWLYRAADIHVRNFHKKMKRELKRASYSFDEDDKFFENYPVYDNYSLLSEKDLHRLISDIYDKLTAEERNLYDLRYRQRLTLKEIARKLNLPYSTLYDKNRVLKSKLETYIKEIADKIEI